MTRHYIMPYHMIWSSYDQNWAVTNDWIRSNTLSCKFDHRAHSCTKKDHCDWTNWSLNFEKIGQTVKSQFRPVWYSTKTGLTELTVALLFESMPELFSVSLLTSSLLQRYESHKNSKRNMYVFVMINIADRRVLWRHFRSTSGFIGCWKIFSQKFLLHQKIRRKISGGVLGSIFHLWPHLVGVITDFHPYVS